MRWRWILLSLFVSAPTLAAAPEFSQLDDYHQMLARYEACRQYRVIMAGGQPELCDVLKPNTTPPSDPSLCTRSGCSVRKIDAATPWISGAGATGYRRVRSSIELGPLPAFRPAQPQLIELNPRGQIVRPKRR